MLGWKPGWLKRTPERPMRSHNPFRVRHFRICAALLAARRASSPTPRRVASLRFKFALIMVIGVFQHPVSTLLERGQDSGIYQIEIFDTDTDTDCDLNNENELESQPEGA